VAYPARLIQCACARAVHGRYGLIRETESRTSAQQSNESRKGERSAAPARRAALRAARTATRSAAGSSKLTHELLGEGARATHS
jgi:hypothetical protein